jgi:CubicO group peptidase (beta-lactamase class C family)
VTPSARPRRAPLLAPLRAALATLLAGACAPPAPPTPAPEPARLALADTLLVAPPAAVGMDPRLGARLDSIVTLALAQGAAPGAVVAVGRHGRLVHLRGYGTLDWGGDAARAGGETLYDLASLTKVVATTTAAMILEERGALDLSRPVRDYLPELDAPDKAAVTVRMLLTHSGGFEAGAALHARFRGQAEYLAQINARPLRSAPGAQTVYSDWDMVLLQAVVERAAGRPLDAFVAERVFAPLGMRDTRFTPDTADRALRRRIAPTATDTARGGVLRGTVHDGNAWALGGVSGHAGLFSTARDLAVFAELLLRGGRYGGARVLAPHTVARWTARQGPGSSRALGWDTPAPGSSAGRHFSPRSFGHTGFTGTSLWVDPERGLFVVILANRVHPRGASTRHVALRRDVADAAQAAILDAPLVAWEEAAAPPR